MMDVGLILKEEGFRGEMYQDHLNNWTIGHGITTMTEEESEAVVKIRADKLADKLRDRYEWFHKLSAVRQEVLVSMAFQLGFTGLTKFKNTMKAIANEEWVRAGEEMMDSRAYNQTKARWDRQIRLFVNG